MVFSGLSPAMVSAASNPLLLVGHGVLREALEGLGSFAVTTMAEPWELVDPAVRSLASKVHIVESMEEAALEAMAAATPPVDAIVGIGGGSAVDAAKYIGWKRGLPVITAPTIVSVDAAVTNTIAVRDGQRVRYVGWVVPAKVVVDLDLVRRAPPELNRAGIGDVLSIHTALFDWRLASRASGEQMDPEIVGRQRRLLDGLFAGADAIREVSDQAIEMLIHAYIANNAACLEAVTAQPEEGSEHFWAYHIEYLTGRHFVHGELVSLGVLVMATLQENEPDRVRAFLDRTGVRYQPAEIGLTREEFARSLTGLHAYTTAEQFWYTIINERPPGTAFGDAVAASLEF